MKDKNVEKLNMTEGMKKEVPRLHLNLYFYTLFRGAEKTTALLEYNKVYPNSGFTTFHQLANSEPYMSRLYMEEAYALAEEEDPKSKYSNPLAYKAWKKRELKKKKGNLRRFWFRLTH